MSLLRPILRNVVVGALRERTWAGNRVFDSDLTPAAELLTEKPEPIITVFTDDDTRSNISGLEVYLPDNRHIAVVLEMASASSADITPDPALTGTPTKAIRFSRTSQALEWQLDAVESQAIAALIGEPSSAWGELFREMVARVVAMPSRRGGKSDSSLRWAARQTILVCEPSFADMPPHISYSGTHPFRTFVSLARTSRVDLKDAADIVEAFLDPVTMPDWQQAQAWFGGSLLDTAIVGSGPLVNFGVTNAEPNMAEWTVHSEDGGPDADTSDPVSTDDSNAA